MKLTWGFFTLYLCYLATVVWCQSLNPLPLSQRSRQPSNVVLPRNFSPRAVQEAFDRAAEIISQNRNSFTARGRVPGRSRTIPESRHQGFLASSAQSITMENLHEIFEEATRVLLNDFNLTPEQIRDGLAETNLKEMLVGNLIQNCEAHFNITTCSRNDRYRTFDGTCNNLRQTSWGMASTCFERLVDPAYADGVASKRRAMSGNELPSPRRLSLEVHSHFENPTDYVNHMFMSFGQFVAHDITLTPLSTTPDNQQLDCCPVAADDPRNCDPILIERDDPFFSTLNIDCLSNARSAMCPTCRLGPREQINQVTSYIDTSHIYGLSLEDSGPLRSNDGTGTMRFVSVDEAGGELPPSSFIPDDDQCSFQDATYDCFQTGDQRGNQHPALTSLHVIFLREHNRIARRLREINPRWDEERLFQETRRIVAAEMQMITYNEYLPLAIGPERMEWFDLNVRRGSQFTEYDETVQATLVHEFAVAAYRFGHSMINSFFQDARGGNSGNYLRDIFSYPFGLYRGQLEGLVGGLTESPSQKFDRYMVRDVTNHLYQFRGNESGLDLASLNINRGRDHGIPGYTTLMKFCGGPDITSFRQLDRLLQRGLRPLFERLYERVEDIDLFTGGLAERPNQGAVVGPTFTCIIGIQFYHLKYGDRFYFEHGGQAGSFTPAQLRELKKANLGRILCENSRIAELPENAFLYQGNRNPMQSCQSKPEINLNAWRE